VQPGTATPAATTVPGTPDSGVAAVTAGGATASSGGHTSTAKDSSDGDNAPRNEAPAAAPVTAAAATSPVAQPASVAQTARAAPAGNPTPVPTTYGVRLAEAAEKVSNAIAMGTRDGVSVARIELSPESLGTIQIHLQHTANGLVARVITEHPEAAQMLSQGGDDLKRQLQQNGTALLRLDIESSGQQPSGGDEQAGSAPGSSDSDPARPDSGSADEGAADAVAQTSTDTPLHTLSGSALVNVLA
jgi:flagellar hook-length control protein FliK